MSGARIRRILGAAAADRQRLAQSVAPMIQALKQIGFDPMACVRAPDLSGVLTPTAQLDARLRSMQSDDASAAVSHSPRDRVVPPHELTRALSVPQLGEVEPSMRVGTSAQARDFAQRSRGASAQGPSAPSLFSRSTDSVDPLVSRFLPGIERSKPTLATSNEQQRASRPVVPTHLPSDANPDVLPHLFGAEPARERLQTTAGHEVIQALSTRVRSSSAAPLVTHPAASHSSPAFPARLENQDDTVPAFVDLTDRSSGEAVTRDSLAEALCDVLRAQAALQGIDLP